MFKLKIDLSNAAFDGGCSRELARILRKLADEIDVQGVDDTDLAVRDINGNLVGEFEIDDAR